MGKKESSNVCFRFLIDLFLYCIKYCIEVLTNCFCFYVSRGEGYRGIYKHYPLDSVYVSGMFHFNRRDRVFVTKLANMGNNPNGEQYKVDEDKAQFGAFRIEGERNENS